MGQASTRRAAQNRTVCVVYVRTLEMTLAARARERREGGLTHSRPNADNTHDDKLWEPLKRAIGDQSSHRAPPKSRRPASWRQGGRGQPVIRHPLWFQRFFGMNVAKTPPQMRCGSSHGANIAHRRPSVFDQRRPRRYEPGAGIDVKLCAHAVAASYHPGIWPWSTLRC